MPKPVELKILRESPEMIEVELEISSIENSKESIFHVEKYSPKFKFLDGKFFFHFVPFDGFRFSYQLVKRDSSSEQDSSEKKDCSFSEQIIDFSSMIKVADGTVFHSYYNKFLMMDEKWGTSVFTKSSFLRLKEVLKPDDKFKIICTLHLADGHKKENDANAKGSVNTLCQNLKDLYINGRQSDVIIRVQGKEFAAHRSILIARSPVFCAMFEHGMAEKNDGEINIEDCDPDSFQDFLLYVYTGDLEVVSPKNAMGLYLTADKYNLPELKAACTQCLASDMSIDFVCDVACLAHEHGELELLKTVTNYFVENGEKILKTPKWQGFITNHFILANELLITAFSKNKK